MYHVMASNWIGLCTQYFLAREFGHKKSTANAVLKVHKEW
jgi:hypothetical protein